jgi:Flp pilus assembly pilin Flp
VRSERGASAVEVALVVALIAVVAIGALKALGGGSAESFEEVAVATEGGAVAPGGGSGGGSGGGGSGSGGGSGGGGGGGGETTSTTAAATTSTTAAATTTTTAAPTTTTAAPTTTTALPPLGSGYPSTSGFQAPTVSSTGGSNKQAATSLVVRDEGGTPVPGASATVTIWYQQRQGNRWVWKRTEVTVTTGANGAVDVTSPSFPTSGSNRVRAIQFELRDSNAPGWDGVEHQQSVSLY